MKSRKQPTDALEFTITLKTADSEEAVRRKAKSHNIEVYKKGSATSRLYFRCSQQERDQFVQELNGLCLAEGPVACPLRLQKTIVRNMYKAATRGLSQVRRKKASSLLLALCGKHKSADGKTESNSVRTEESEKAKPSVSQDN